MNWPAQHPVISTLALDGDGNLFVFPYSFAPPQSRPSNAPGEPEAVPVDVYSPTGDRIFAGLIPIPNWSAALGDHLYRLETDPATDEPLIVRYRFVEPFD